MYVVLDEASHSSSWLSSWDGRAGYKDSPLLQGAWLGQASKERAQASLQAQDCKFIFCHNPCQFE